MNSMLHDLGIDRLSAAERLELIGQIWDSLDDDRDEAALPDWHIELLERRLAVADANPGAGIPLEVVLARLGKQS